MPWLDSLSYYLLHLLHLLTGFAMLAVFLKVYCWLTPFDELALISKGVSAAAVTLGGAVVGFSLTIAASIMHNATYPAFVLWGVAGMAAQLACYLAQSRFIPHLEAALEADNTAVAILSASLSISVGLINAGCMS
jgi:putative membrane protein